MTTLSIRLGLRDRAGAGTAMSVRAIAKGLSMHEAVSVRAIFHVLEPILLTPLLDTGTCSGSCQIAMSSDGQARYSGHIHNSGAISVHYTVATAINASLDPHTLSPPILIVHQGSVEGTFTPGSRNDSWDESISDARIALQWGPIKAAAATASTQVGTDAGGTQIIEALLGGAVGVYLFKL